MKNERENDLNLINRNYDNNSGQNFLNSQNGNLIRC